jgi:hypothetical protein
MYSQQTEPLENLNMQKLCTEFVFKVAFAPVPDRQALGEHPEKLLHKTGSHPLHQTVRT